MTADSAAVAGGRRPSAGAVRLAELLAGSERAVALTGAGISVPSGIPDFRTPGKGLWENVNPMEVAHIDAFRRDPDRFWTFYSERFASLRDKEPNPAHAALVELERRGLLRAVVTQNVDRLHRLAGTRHLVEVHGSIDACVCLQCRGRFSLGQVLDILAMSAGAPECPACIAALKPDVVLFGEMLPAAAIGEAFALAQEADVLLCIGSSLEVYPVASLPQATLDAGGRVAILTQGPTPYDRRAALRLDGDVVEELTGVLAALGAA